MRGWKARHSEDIAQIWLKTPHRLACPRCTLIWIKAGRLTGDKVAADQLTPALMQTSLFRSLALLLATSGSLWAANTLGEAIGQGTVSANVRARFEGVHQTALRDADAVTLRTRVGYTTAPWQGLKAMVEGEHIVAAKGDKYSQAGLNPAATGRAVVGDPETEEVNQVFLAYTSGKTTATLGRQRIVLDNTRFIGDVGWRQNMQTYDAFLVQDKTFDKTTLTYAYLDQVNRVFSARHPQGKWDSDSHALNASYTGLPAGTLTGYAYLLDFAKLAAANSCATYGASFAGTQPLNTDVKVAYRAELATQSDYGASTLNYDALYATVSAGLVGKPGSLTIGYEQLGSDNNVGFKTPIATLHAVNGWADLFTATPAAGLQETYLRATANLPEGFVLTASYHQFKADGNGTKFGEEYDAQLTRKFGKYVTGLVKIANFRRDSLAFPNVQKVWAQVEFAY